MKQVLTGFTVENIKRYETHGNRPTAKRELRALRRYYQPSLRNRTANKVTHAAPTPQLLTGSENLLQ